MTQQEAIKSIILKLASGNSIPIQSERIDFAKELKVLTNIDIINNPLKL